MQNKMYMYLLIVNLMMGEFFIKGWFNGYVLIIIFD